MPPRGPAIRPKGRIIAPLADFGEPALKLIQPMPYTDWQAFFDASYPHGRRYYWKGNLHRELSDEVLNGMVEVGSNPPITWGNVVIEWYKGAMNRVDPAATAFPHRDAEFQIVCIGGWDDEADDVIGTIWTRSVAEATGTGALNGAFLDFNSRRRLWTGHGTGEGRLRREPGAPARNQAALRPDEPLPGEQQHRAVGLSPGASRRPPKGYPARCGRRGYERRRAPSPVLRERGWG